MVDELIQIISEEQKNISASEVAGCIKVASSMFPALATAGLAGLGVGVLGTQMANSREKAEAERRNKITNLLSAAAGAGGGYYLGTGGSLELPGTNSLGNSYDPEISISEMSKIYGR